MEMEKLDSKSLMIGDWVLCECVLYDKENISVSKLKHAKITGIKEDYFYCETNDDEIIYCERYSMIKPIPLTAEILEKNGFKYNEAESVGEWDAYDFPLGIGFFIEKNPMDKTFRITDHRFINVRYVHEFQQLLRLCKIDKEIEL